MTRRRHPEEEISAVLKDAQAGISVPDLCQARHLRRHILKVADGVCRPRGLSDAKKLRQLEEENRRLKQMVAEQALDIQASLAVV
jgi:putative transposase